jgi:hypothetical protein
VEHRDWLLMEERRKSPARLNQERRGEGVLTNCFFFFFFSNTPESFFLARISDVCHIFATGYFLYKYTKIRYLTLNVYEQNYSI